MVVIGAGGSGASTGQSAGAGSNTYLQSIDMPNFNTIYANGGGAGGDSLSTLGTSGGSGGGGVAAIALAYSQSLPGQGYNGGIADTTYGGGGGGGGAGPGPVRGDRLLDADRLPGGPGVSDDELPQ